MGDNWRCAQLASCSCTSMYVVLCLAKSWSSVSSVLGMWWWGIGMWWWGIVLSAESIDQYKRLYDGRYETRFFNWWQL